MEEERSSWRAQLAQLAAQEGGKGGKSLSAAAERPYAETLMAKRGGTRETHLWQR
jgi:hypothetical protein